MVSYVIIMLIATHSHVQLTMYLAITHSQTPKPNFFTFTVGLQNYSVGFLVNRKMSVSDIYGLKKSFYG